jgi:hypothetical protein
MVHRVRLMMFTLMHCCKHRPGHGATSAGEDYLIPVDIEEPCTIELTVQGDLLQRNAERGGVLHRA